jgi:thiamine-phosphate pyrophosphorylase
VSFIPGPLYAIVDPSHLLIGCDLTWVTRAILCGGASVVQLRDNDSSDREVFARAVKLSALCKEFEVPFIVNNRLDIALASGAAGVHLGPGDLPVEAARRAAGDDFVIGASAGNPDVACALEEAGATYLGVGALFEARRTKPDASPPRGVSVIRAVVDVVTIPVVGIGGINRANASSVIDQGAHGIAVVSALLRSEDPERAARSLCQVVSR